MIDQNKRRKLRAVVIGKWKGEIEMSVMEKAKRRIRAKWISFASKKKNYYWFYRSYWHSKVIKSEAKDDNDRSHLYFAARPNPGAGIGHQMANWISGYWFAKEFGLHFAHIPFASQKWEKFLGFYIGEKKIEDLKKNGYHVIQLPLFDEYNVRDISQIDKIIDSYCGRKIIFLAEQDQFYHDQYGVLKELQDKFYSAPERKNDKLIYDNQEFNIAIHVRRGDIVQKSREENPNLTMRFQSNEYFSIALDTALKYLEDKKNIQIYLFSQGVKEDYPDFLNHSNIHFCLDMGAEDSFLHMVYADALITSKSSFSYKPALLNRGIKFSPKNFWHGYPDKEEWVLLNENGEID